MTQWFLAILWVFAFSGCTKLYKKPPPAFKMEASYLSQKTHIYETFRVEKTEGQLATIDGRTYSPHAAAAYYLFSGADEALEWQRLGFNERAEGNAALPYWIIAGGGIGAVPGWIWALNTYDSFGLIKAAIFGVCLAGGAVLGSITGFSSKYGYHRPRSDAYFKKAGESFNQKILKDLQLELAPTPGGFKGGLGTHF